MIDDALQGGVNGAPNLDGHGKTLFGDAITFRIEIGAPPESRDAGLVVCPLDDRDLAHGPLVFGRLRGRAPPVATAKFAEHLARRLDAIRRMPMAAAGADDARR